MSNLPITIKEESFSLALFKETLPLAKKCWAENTKAKGETCAFYGLRDFEIEPDFEQYQQCANLGILTLTALREAERLQGYIVGMLMRSLHHKRFLVMMVDSAYVEPDWRSYTPVMITKFETVAKSMGAVIIGWPTHSKGPVYEFLQASGYVGDDVIMEKRICAL